MNTVPKLIMLNGFAGCGKSTIAKKYVDEHPLALCIEGDEIIAMLGQWKSHYDSAITCKLALTESLVSTHLHSGYDVVLPFLLTDEVYAETYARVADKAGAVFFEILLVVEREDAIRRLLKRGTWGEKGLPPLTDKDLPEIEKLYDDMVTATATRSNTIAIHPRENDIEGTYQELLAAIASKRA